MWIIFFKDPKRTPLRFTNRVWYTGDYGGWSGWYVYPDRVSRPVMVLDSEIDRIEEAL